MTPAVLTIVSAAALAAAGLAFAPRGPAAAPAGPSPAVLDAVGPRAYSPGTAREAAAVRGAGIPLPAGGNFNGIRWELATGEIPAATIDAVLRYNAACQWLRASASAPAALAAQLAALRRGGRQMLAQCLAAHAREVAYARRLDLTPST